MIMKSNHSIRYKILSTYIIPMVVSLIAVSTYLITQAKEKTDRQILEFGSLVTSYFSEYIRFPLYAGNFNEISRITESIVKQRNVSAAIVYNKSGTALAYYPPDILHRDISNLRPFHSLVALPSLTQKHDDSQLYPETARIDDDIIGSVEIYVTDKFIHEDEYYITKKTIIIITIFTIISLIIAYILSQKIIKPILRLCDIVKDVQNGNFSPRINNSSNDEIGLLESGINTMIIHLSEYRDDMESKVTSSTVELVSLIEMLGATDGIT